jgi:hypothetical protein
LTVIVKDINDNQAIKPSRNNRWDMFNCTIGIQTATI